MLSLTYILTILILKQSLYVLVNAQQDLYIKPSVWNNPLYQLPSENYQPANDNYSHQKATFSTNYNHNNLNPVPIFNSYYGSVIPIVPQPIPNSNSHVSNKHNWIDILEGRSAPIKPPVELHHGYRYNTPAISFSNIAHLRNVIYNELGLDKNPNSYPSSPQGFELKQTQKDTHNTEINVEAQKPSETEILTHHKNGDITKIGDHRKIQNITILTPVNNLTFTYHYVQPNVLDHKQFIHENNKTSADETTSKYSRGYNSTININAQNLQHLKLENKTPDTLSQSETNFNHENFASNITKNVIMQSGVEPTIDSLSNFQRGQISNVQPDQMSNLQPGQKELTLNIRPSIQLFQNIDPGNVVLQSSSESTLKLDSTPPNVSQTEFNNQIREVNNKNVLQYDHFNKPPANDFVTHTTTAFSGLLERKPDVQLSHNTGSLNEKNVNTPIPLSEYQQHLNTLQNQYMPIQSFSHDKGVTNTGSLNEKNGNSPIPLSEYQQYLNILQNQYMPIQSFSHDKGVTNDQPLYSFSPNIVNRYAPLDKHPFGENQQHIFGHLSTDKNNVLNNKPLESVLPHHQKNNVLSLDEKPANQYTSLDKNPFEENQQHNFREPGLLSNVKNNHLNFQQLGNPIIQQQNKFSNYGHNLQNQIHKEMKLNLTLDSKRQNQIIFPNNFVLFDSTNLATRIPTVPHLQSNKIIHQQMTHSYITDQRPSIVFNKYINPRTANHQTESSNYTQTKVQETEFPLFNKTDNSNIGQQKVQPKTPIVFPSMVNKKVRTPHLIYGSPF